MADDSLRLPLEIITIVKKIVWHRGCLAVAITKYNEAIIRLLQGKTKGK